jgi:hypothetical protein
MQLWQDTVKGINETGKADLTKEEWSALTTLNNSLSSGNFLSDESRRSFALLKDNLSRHSNNPALHLHLQNFINLCGKYLNPVVKSSSIQVKPTVNTSKAPRKGNGSVLTTIVIAGALIIGYFIYNGNRKTPTTEVVATQKSESVSNSSTQKEPVQNEPKTKIADKSAQSPPIANTRGTMAKILFPKNWDGKSILANSFVWIDDNDIALQNKYNIHPNGENFLDDHEFWDDDDTFYFYSLSPNVVIEAGIMSENCYPCKTRKMSVDTFADYMRNLGYGVEKDDGSDAGIVASVIYKNGMITKIEEIYTP